MTVLEWTDAPEGVRGNIATYKGKALRIVHSVGRVYDAYVDDERFLSGESFNETEETLIRVLDGLS